MADGIFRRDFNPGLYLYRRRFSPLPRVYQPSGSRLRPIFGSNPAGGVFRQTTMVGIHQGVSFNIPSVVVPSSPVYGREHYPPRGLEVPFVGFQILRRKFSPLAPYQGFKFDRYPYSPADGPFIGEQILRRKFSPLKPYIPFRSRRYPPLRVTEHVMAVKHLEQRNFTRLVARGFRRKQLPYFTMMSMPTLRHYSRNTTIFPLLRRPWLFST